MLDLIILLALFLLLYAFAFLAALACILRAMTEQQIERAIDRLAWFIVDCEFRWHDFCYTWFPPGQPIITITIRRLPQDD